ncbi:hypothetical protein CH238_04975 [[Clostridium] leptum DSM 753]|uniref:Uncharacterized protein n=1 Tax=[Clostridium] leptum DSM 753 TaxID=428125 RepID=A0A855A875_9FIRM|nr:hypothetical protein CH238_04975 [[Clostridium] leptum DSM 753]
MGEPVRPAEGLFLEHRMKQALLGRSRVKSREGSALRFWNLRLPAAEIFKSAGSLWKKGGLTCVCRTAFYRN